MIPSKILCRDVSLAEETFSIDAILLHAKVSIAHQACNAFVIQTAKQFYLVVSGGINQIVSLGLCSNPQTVPIAISEFKEQLLVALSSGQIRYFIWQKQRLVQQQVTYLKDLNYMLTTDESIYLVGQQEIVKMGLTYKSVYPIDCRDVSYACIAYNNLYVIKNDGETATFAYISLAQLEQAKSTIFNAEKAQFVQLFYSSIIATPIQLAAQPKRPQVKYLINSAYLSRSVDYLYWISGQHIHTLDLRSQRQVVRKLSLQRPSIAGSREIVDITSDKLNIFSRQDEYFILVQSIDILSGKAEKSGGNSYLTKKADSADGTPRAQFMAAGEGLFHYKGEILSLRDNPNLVDEFKSILRSSILTRSSETDYLILNFVSLSPDNLDTDYVILETLLRHLQMFVTSDVLKICSKCLQNKLKSECYEIVINIVRTMRCYDYAKDLTLMYQFMQKLLQISTFGQSFYIQEIFKSALDKFGHLYLCLFDYTVQDDYTRIFEELAVFAGLNLKLILQNYRSQLDDKADYSSMTRACDSTLSTDNVYTKTIGTLVDLLILSGRSKDARKVVNYINGIVPLLFIKMQPEHFTTENVEVKHLPIDISAILKANNWFYKRSSSERFNDMLDREIKTIEQINQCHCMLDELSLYEKNILFQTVAVHPLVKVSSPHQMLFMEIFCQIYEENASFEPSQQQFELMQDILASTSDRLQLFNLLNKHNNVQLIIWYARQTGNYLSAISLLLQTNYETIGLYNGVLYMLQSIKLEDVNLKELGDNADELIEPIWIIFKLIFDYTVGPAESKSQQNLKLFKQIFLERETILLKILRYVIVKTTDSQEIEFIERLDLDYGFLAYIWACETGRS